MENPRFTHRAIHSRTRRAGILETVGEEEKGTTILSSVAQAKGGDIDTKRFTKANAQLEPKETKAMTEAVQRLENGEKLNEALKRSGLILGQAGTGKHFYSRAKE